MVGCITPFIWVTMLATRNPAVSSPKGKITLAAGILIWSHLMDGGFPPNSWALVNVVLAVISNNNRIRRNEGLFMRGESKKKCLNLNL